MTTIISKSFYLMSGELDVFGFGQSATGQLVTFTPPYDPTVWQLDRAILAVAASQSSAFGATLYMLVNGTQVPLLTWGGSGDNSGAVDITSLVGLGPNNFQLQYNINVPAILVEACVYNIQIQLSVSTISGGPPPPPPPPPPPGIGPNIVLLVGAGALAIVGITAAAITLRKKKHSTPRRRNGNAES